MKGHIEEDKIALLAGGDLPAGEIPAVASHISRCDACQAVLEGYRQSRQAMASLRDVSIRDGEFVEVRQAVLKCLAVRRPLFRLVSWPHLAPLRAGVLATLLLAVTSIGTYVWKKAHEPQFTETPAQAAIPPEAVERPPAGPRVDPAAQSAPAPRIAQEPGRRTGRQGGSAPIAAELPSDRAATDPQTQAHPPVVPDDVVMKLETSDPNVIIIWLASPKGAGR